MNLYACKMCGHIAFDSKPAACPACGNKEFQQNDDIFKESEEKGGEAAVKHIPAITIKKQCGLIPEGPCSDAVVRIGKTLHPMEEKHFIRFIDCYVDNRYLSRIMLTPGVHPAGSFHIKADGNTLVIVENCTIHGYWMSTSSLT